VTGLSAHELRVLSVYWAYHCHVPLHEIMSALFLRSNGVFLNHYLRDLSEVRDGFRLVPIVAAGQVTNLPGQSQ
jgi:hypothetical protein